MVMAPTTGEEQEPTGSAVADTPPSVAIEAKLTLDGQKLKDVLKSDNATTTMAMDANVMVSTDHDEECQKLKDLLNKKEATVTVVATVVSKKKQAAPAEAKKPSLTSSQLSFLVAASEGDLEGLKSLLSSGTGDVEEGNNAAARPAFVASLMESVTLEGDTALHLVAANGGSSGRGSKDFEGCAKLIHEREKGLLYKQNKRGDTPMHCAARAGKSQLVSCLIELAEGDDKVQDLLRTNNDNNETALHDAVRRGDKEIVEVLLRADSELACFPTNGTSPLYLTILMTDNTMAQMLRYGSKDHVLSYLGPNGQNALHAAVLRGPELTRKLLQWNEDLARQKDEKGSTPLHFAAGLLRAPRRGSVCSQVFKANPDALFELDNNGLSPIHVAASVGALETIDLFVKERPSSAGLRDTKGRTFLHVAIENKQVAAVYRACVISLLLRITCVNPLLLRITCSFQCMTPSQQAWIMNMQDNDGNTAVHLAVKSGSLLMFNALFGNKNVNLNMTNVEGQTPLDIAEYKVPPGLFYNQNSESLIRHALREVGARKGVSRLDHFWEKYQDIHGLKSEYESKELENMKDLTQSRSIAAVLIATVAFGATFALPGGYRADDHTNGGTPTLAGRYAFDGFLMANTLAFMFSTGAVASLVRGGSPTFNRISRQFYLAISFHFMELSITCFVTAFALGAFVVLAPVARKTAISICVITPLILLFNRAEYLLKCLLLVKSFWVRKRLLWTSSYFVRSVFGVMFQHFWPFLLIFIWATYGRTHPISEVEQPAHPPSA